jgi:hypothetical protein
MLFQVIDVRVEMDTRKSNLHALEGQGDLMVNHLQTDAIYIHRCGRPRLAQSVWKHYVQSQSGATVFDNQFGQFRSAQ